jgi:hypothetical protein
MTVSVKLPDGGVDQYLRHGDSYVKHSDGTLEVIRNGVKEHPKYPAGQWADVSGDEHKHKVGFWR